MSHTPPRTTVSGPGPGTEQTVALADETGIGDVLTALEDAECRAILEATSTEALSASEVADTCDIALSTTYRKLDLLDDVGLLEEGIRLSESGKHTSEYRLRFEDISVSIDPETGFELSLSGAESVDQGTWAFAGAD